MLTSSQCNAGALPLSGFKHCLAPFEKRLPRLFANKRKPSNQPTNPPTNQLFRNSPWALQIGVFQTYSDTLLHARQALHKQVLALGQIR